MSNHTENASSQFARRLLRCARAQGLRPLFVQHEGDPDFRCWIDHGTETEQVREITAASLCLVVFADELHNVGSFLVIHDNAPDYADMIADFTDRPAYVRAADGVTGGLMNVE